MDWKMYGDDHKASILDGGEYVILSISCGMLATSIAIPAQDALQMSSQMGLTAMAILDRAEAADQHMRQVSHENTD